MRIDSCDDWWQIIFEWALMAVNVQHSDIPIGLSSPSNIAIHSNKGQGFLCGRSGCPHSSANTAQSIKPTPPRSHPKSCEEKKASPHQLPLRNHQEA